MPIKKIAILGSTGSIGTQALEVVQHFPERLEVSVLTAQKNVNLLANQARQFKPKMVVIGDENLYSDLKIALQDLNIELRAGAEALVEAVQMPEIDTVLTALVGFAGLKPTLSAITAGKNIALANKETLVVAGELVNEACKKHQIKLYPVDSEHSAIFQCLLGESQDSIEKIILTASGGPFRGYSIEQLKNVSKAQALKHPNWSMGAKITIDSASLMNKGLEVIEARWLFDISDEQIEVVVHPQSIIHSMVQFNDGSIKAQMGLPDMRLPIQLALTFPDRPKNNFPRFDFLKYPQLTFEKPDFEAFPNLKHAFHALAVKGNMPCIINAANEVAVDLFLNEKIRFCEISEVIANAMQKMPFVKNPSLEDLFATDSEVRARH